MRSSRGCARSCRKVRRNDDATRRFDVKQAVASSLWASADCAEWRAALATYETAVRGRGASRLEELDAWVRNELPSAIASRTPKHVTKDELVRVTEWKMKRGEWRARNLALVRANTEDDVRAKSQAAFAAMPDVRKPIALLMELGGVGPATASAIAFHARPDVYPFFDEVIALQIDGLGNVAFTLPYYLRYAERLRARASELSAACTETWTAHGVGQALWAAANPA